MKELSIEEKAKRYDKAIEKLHEIITMDNKPVNPKEIGEHLFPELSESEGEGIRKALLEMVHDTTGDSLWVDYNVHKEDAIAWLEKQCDANKEYWRGYREGKKEILDKYSELEKQGEQKSYASETMNEKGDFDSGFTRMMEKEQKPTDAKEYDFRGIKFIPKFAKGDIIKDKKRGEVSTIEGFSYDTGLYTHTYGQFPITIQDNYEIIEQKPAWSEEDKNYYDTIIAILENTKDDAQLSDSQISFLKSLRPQSQWKPSEEQIRWLYCAMDDAEKGSRMKQVLYELLEQLKKLND